MRLFSTPSIFCALLASMASQILVPGTTQAQSLLQGRENPENFHLEIMGSGWLVHPGGKIQANGTPADFISDLNVSRTNPTFFGQLVYKPGRRHRITVEGTPFQINGLNTINRPIIYRGRTFNVNETVASTSSLDYIFAGYQYDVLTGPKGHLGFNVGAAYLNATGTLATQTNAVAGSATISATKNQKLALPLAGVDFRIFPVPHRSLFEIEGGIRGMQFGGYGYYVQATAQGGVSLGPITLLAGYRAVNTSIYVNSNGTPSGITARLKGPIFSGMFRW